MVVPWVYPLSLGAMSMVLKSFIVAVAVAIPALAFADSEMMPSVCKSDITASCKSMTKKQRVMNARAEMYASAAWVSGLNDANSMYGSNSAASNDGGRSSGGAGAAGGGGE
jgi:hypothetical protein